MSDTPVPTQADLTAAMSRLTRASLPGGPVIVREATAIVLQEMGFTGDVAWLKANFSGLVEEVQVKAYERYLAVEAPAAAAAFRQVLGPLMPPNPTQDDFFRVLGNNFTALDRYFLGLTQGRRPRAGKAFEQVIRTLFDQLGYPYTPQPIIDGQPDFLLPSVEHYRSVAMDCIIFTVKRTLRERWRQIVTEGQRGLHFFLATIDETIPARDFADMTASRIYIVVPERIKMAFYPTVQNAISFEAFFQQHLDPAMARWKANGVIKA